MFTIIFGGIGVIIDLLIILAIIVIGGKILVKIVTGLKNIFESLKY